MSWISAGIVGASTLLGASQGAANRKAQQEANQQNATNAAAQTEFSPWTKAGPGQFTAAPVTESAFGSGAKGALSGAMFAQGVENNKMQQEQAKTMNDYVKSKTSIPGVQGIQDTPEEIMKRLNEQNKQPYGGWSNQ